MLARLRGLRFEGPRRLVDDHVPRVLAPVALLAWIGLGADGLSSTSYGPAGGFVVLRAHPALVPWLALALVGLIAIVSATYRHVLAEFPTGGGGYSVAVRELGPAAGIVSGGALLGDYALTIAVSVAAGVAAIFSFLPLEWQSGRLPATWIGLVLLTGLDLRGIRGTAGALVAIAAVFLASHVALIAVGLLHPARSFAETFAPAAAAAAPLGLVALAALFLRSFAAGGATLGGIEALSNALPALEEPRVPTGRRAMVALAIALAVLAAGLLLCYALAGLRPEAGRTLNASLWQSIAGGWRPGGLPVGPVFVAVTLASEAALLWIAAQIGFVGGPQTLAAMALDQWVPKRLAHLSERLVVQNGIVAMGLMAAAVLSYTGARVDLLVVVYAVNVLIALTLTQAGMARRWWRERARVRHLAWRLGTALAGALVTAVLLVVTVVARFHQGGGAALLVAGVLIGLCSLVRAHYRHVRGMLRTLDDVLGNLPLGEHGPSPELATEGPTAVVLVESYNGLGIHTLLSIQRMFPHHYRNFVFCSVGVLDAGPFKGAEETAALEARVRADLEKYAELARRMGAYAEYRYTLGTDVISELETMCLDITREFRRTVVFAGQLVFQRENLFTRSFHHETAFAIQRRLQFRGVQVVILPIRVWEPARAA